ncbi:hypothetical protein ACS0TY_033360 [Phlomoides rotata]
MALVKIIFFMFVCRLLLLNPADSECEKSFRCGGLSSLEFPLSRVDDPECGVFLVDGCDSDNPIIQLEAGGRWYEILRKVSQNSLSIRDPEMDRLSKAKNCYTFHNLSMPKSPHSSFIVSPNITFFTCWTQTHFEYYSSKDCPPFTLYFPNTAGDPDPPEVIPLPQQCSLSRAPFRFNPDSSEAFQMITAEFTLEWNVYDNCSNCHNGGGQCLTNTRNEFVCKRGNRSKWNLALALCGGGILLLLLGLLVFWLRKKRIERGYIHSRNISSYPSSRSDIEGGSFNYGIPIFSYTELEKATNNFDPCKELGDGGFGTVYYGKLRDGREVAIKRLYEHNFKRVEQFLNEIKILTGLRHPNLVSLYGCTSRRSRELLLVYEYIANGTVADHLHGDRAKEALVTWPIRMNIAIETATALAYLHKSDIIHRDVKTYNILLDSNFSVKVADFGLSRLFPENVTHISTAPQGTPGYVDPEYHQYYQLTDKSDVYSFGVVLVELISSMPAVDMDRHRHEINLANLALDRIQRCAFDELIDSSLGYGSDPEVTRMTTTVAELAFRCLQLEKELRPSMDEVVALLKDIERGEGVDGNHTVPGKIIPSPETDDVVLLKNKNFQSSPTSVIHKWGSIASTTTSSFE